MKKIRLAAVTLIAALFFCIVPAAHASGGDTSTTVSLSATMVSALTVTCTPSTVNFGASVPIINGFVVTATTPVVCNFTWSTPSGAMLAAYAGFTSNIALTGTAGTIPTSDFAVQDNSGAFNPCIGNWNINSAIPGGGLTQGNICGPALANTFEGPNVGSSTETLTFQFTEPTNLSPGSLAGSIVVDVSYL